MTNILLILILLVLCGIGYLLYRIFLVIKDPIKEEIMLDPVGITAGIYAPTYSGTNDNIVGISEAKTPQLIEFEAEQELLKRTQAMGR